MDKYTKDELLEAKKALSSTLHKLIIMQEKDRLKPAQKTLNNRRVSAIKLALDLIEKELNNYEENRL